MGHSHFAFAFFVIFFGASVLATLALYTRQSLLVAYLILGIIVGPFGLKLISQTQVIGEISNVGIMFLLFLLGLNMQPRNLFTMLRGATIVTLSSCLIFGLVSLFICHALGLSWGDSLMVGVAMMFSSTIIGLKLLPTTALHHQRIGEVMVSILLMQDIVAILVLMVLGIMGVASDHGSIYQVLRTLVALPIVIALAYFAERYVLHKLFRRFNRVQEYLFLVAIGWCLALAQLADALGISYEIGAFIAGVSLAASPISQFIAESLKPLRDFFLVVFFFSVGAVFNFHLLPQVWLPVLVLTVVILLLKPATFLGLLRTVDESKRRAWQVGMRLGQASEFSLLVAFLAYQAKFISQQGYITIQAVTILTFIVSSYLVVFFYPSPMSLKPAMRRD